MSAILMWKELFILAALDFNSLYQGLHFVRIYQGISKSHARLYQGSQSTINLEDHLRSRIH